MESRKTQKITIYSRKSKFTGKGESIENQIELCRQYIYTHFPTIEEDNIFVYEDEGFSGGNVKRPQFKKMMFDAKKHKFSAIVCYRLDRISRNIGDFAKLIEELEALDVSFISIKEQFDTSSPLGRAMMYISSVFSQLERETIAERIRDNMHELSKTGRWLGGTTPTGYSSEGVESATWDGKKKKAYKLTLLPEEARLVRRIFAKFLETNSLTKTETFLLQNNYTTKRGKHFTRFAIKNILSNPVYMIADQEAYHFLVANEVHLFAQESDFDCRHGIMAYNRTMQTTGRAHQVRPIKEWIVAVGKHVGMISGTDWLMVQDSIAQNRVKAYRKPRSNTALLSGLLFCGNCGDYLRPKLGRRLNDRGERIYSYLCAMKEKSRLQRCDMKNAAGNILDGAVSEEIKKLKPDIACFIRRLEIGRQALIGNREDNDANLAGLSKALEENESRIAALVAALGKSAASAAGDYIVKQINALHGDGEALRRQINELEELAACRAFSQTELESLGQSLVSFRAIFDRMNLEQRRAALRSLIARVEWDGAKAQLYLFGFDDSEGIALSEPGDRL